MSWSLQLHNGDFTVSQASLGTVTHQYKLVQDLRCALLEHMGTDDLHPTYGSLLDGGTLPDGSTVAGAIGQHARQAAVTVQAEIMRIAQVYKNQQLNRAKSDRIAYNRISLTPAEVLINVSGVSIIQEQDTLLVTVSLQTAAGQDLSVVFPLATNS